MAVDQAQPFVLAAKFTFLQYFMVSEDECFHIGFAVLNTHMCKDVAYILAHCPVLEKFKVAWWLFCRTQCFYACDCDFCSNVPVVSSRWDLLVTWDL